MGSGNGSTWGFLTFLGGLFAGLRSDALPLALEVSLRAVSTKAPFRQYQGGMAGGVLPARDGPLSNECQFLSLLM